MKQNVAVLIGTIVLLLLAAPAEADMQSFTNPSDWTAATSSVFTIDFNDVPVGVNGFTDYSVTGLLIHDVDFSANPNSEEGLVAYSQASAYTYKASYSGGFLVGNTWGPKVFSADLPSNVTALALLVLTQTPGGNVILTFPGYTYTLATTSDSTPDFIGFTFDAPIASVTIDSSDRSYVGIDDFAYGAVTSTPEASSIWLAGFGLAALVVARCLRRLRLAS